MPRRARKQSQSGYYHIIVRGNGKQILFEEDADRVNFLSTLARYSREAGIMICAYCLMENHVHLLVHDSDNNITGMMKKIGISYSEYFNRKYDRTGHLFQGRFLSEPVETEHYLLTVFRYILRNPEKAGLCKVSEYPWSSYMLYGDSSSFVDTSMLQGLIGDMEAYRTFVSGDLVDECMEFETRVHDDSWALSVIRHYLHSENGTILQSYSKRQRDEAIMDLLNKGLSRRQLERLTGISKGAIQRIVEKKR